MNILRWKHEETDLPEGWTVSGGGRLLAHDSGRKRFLEVLFPKEAGGATVLVSPKVPATRSMTWSFDCKGSCVSYFHPIFYWYDGKGVFERRMVLSPVRQVSPEQWWNPETASPSCFFLGRTGSWDWERYRYVCPAPTGALEVCARFIAIHRGGSVCLHNVRADS